MGHEAEQGLSTEESIQGHLQAVERGLPFGVFTRLQNELGLSKSELAELAQISTRTLNRRKERGFFSPTESERLHRFEELLKAAERVLATRDDAREWLKTPLRALGGYTPLMFAKHETGAREVFDLLGRLEYGVFS
ncbi:MAG: antitoxin Xre-like helix-turn-helix domain-containing protein [Desulfohalobiaceae bacterium]